METKISNCIFCGSSNLGVLDGYSHASLLKCKSCTLVFSSLIPSAELLNEHYGNYPRYTTLSPITEKRYNELLDVFENSRKTNNLIDLGCSNGLFLQIAQKRGWNVYGTEYDPGCIAYAKKNGITIFKSDELPDELFKMEFDVVTSFEVIEHINYPNQEAQFLNQLLRKGGMAYITTPNFNSFSRYYLREKWNVIGYPEHLTYFTPKTLNNLMSSNGFEKIYLKTTGIALSRLRKSLGKKETSDINEKNTDEHLREKIEKGGVLSIVKKTINFFLNLFKIGDAMKGLYRKR